MARLPKLANPADFRKVVPSSPTGVIGRIVRVNRSGIAYASVPVGENYLFVHYPRETVAFPTEDGQMAEVSPENAKTVTFTFDKITNYHGEEPEQIGLREGALVEFEAPEGIVRSAKLV